MPGQLNPNPVEMRVKCIFSPFLFLIFYLFFALLFVWLLILEKIWFGCWSMRLVKWKEMSNKWCGSWIFLSILSYSHYQQYPPSPPVQPSSSSLLAPLHPSSPFFFFLSFHFISFHFISFHFIFLVLFDFDSYGSRAKSPDSRQAAQQCLRIL